MAWSAPMTAVANSVFTAAQFNTYVRDNLNETGPAKATAAGRLIVTTGANSITERVVSRALVSTSETTTSTSYTNLATVGPTLTVTTGANVMIFWTMLAHSSVSDGTCSMSFDVSGATTQAAADTWSLILESSLLGVDLKAAGVHYLPVTAGSNTFTAKYKVSGSSTGTFADRQIFVIPL